jgi:hypothetical protein
VVDDVDGNILVADNCNNKLAEVVVAACTDNHNFDMLDDDNDELRKCC